MIEREFSLLIKYPSRERPHQFFDVLNKAQRLRGTLTTQFLITLDENDPTMNCERSIGVLKMWGNLKYIFGESKSKVHAINRDMEQAKDWDVLLLLSDDMHCNVQDYDKIICDLFKEKFPDTDGVLWINDGYAGRKLNTLVCVGRKYFERFNYIYEPSYHSLFCDNEFTDVSVKLNKFHYVEQVLIQHQHPMNTKHVRSDSLYKRNDSYYLQDKDNYEKRKALMV